MTEDQIKPGVQILYHGGWDSTKTERCSRCNFSCGYIMAGVIVERYKLWDPSQQIFIFHPDHLWIAQLESGAYVSGDHEQFELV